MTSSCQKVKGLELRYLQFIIVSLIRWALEDLGPTWVPFSHPTGYPFTATNPYFYNAVDDLLVCPSLRLCLEYNSNINEGIFFKLHKMIEDIDSKCSVQNLN